MSLDNTSIIKKEILFYVGAALMNFLQQAASDHYSYLQQIKIRLWGKHCVR